MNKTCPWCGESLVVFSIYCMCQPCDKRWTIEFFEKNFKDYCK